MQKVIGKIIEFDGMSGTLVDRDKNEYIFTHGDLENKDLKVGDIVVFEKELFKTIDVQLNLARFIKKMDREKTR